MQILCFDADDVYQNILFPIYPFLLGILGDMGENFTM